MKAEDIIKSIETIRDETREAANTATRVGSTLLMMLQFLIGDATPFLRKDQPDSTNHLLTSLAGAVIGKNGRIKSNPDGSITAESIRILGSAIFNEIVANHQHVWEGDVYFTDRAIIDTVETTGLNTYRLTFRKEYDDEQVTFHKDDILLAQKNDLNISRTFQSAWMHVDSVDAANNTADVSMYGDKDVPGGKNFAPQHATLAVRRGNSVDKSRQSFWFISSNEGRMLFIQGASKPILDDNTDGSNYAGFVGLPPDIVAVRDLIQKKIITANQPYAYFRGMLAQDFIKVDYNGNPQYIGRDKGQWSESETYIRGYDEKARGYYVDRVWHGGCYWQCNVDSCTGSEPMYGNADWSCLIGGGNMIVDINSTEGDSFPAGSDWTTELVAEVWNAEMYLPEDRLMSLGMQVNWQRISQDPVADKAWNAGHPTGADTLTLQVDSKKDLPSVWKAGSKVGFKCTVIFPDGKQKRGNYSIVN